VPEFSRAFAARWEAAAGRFDCVPWRGTGPPARCGPRTRKPARTPQARGADPSCPGRGSASDGRERGDGCTFNFHRRAASGPQVQAGLRLRSGGGGGLLARGGPAFPVRRYSGPRETDGTSERLYQRGQHPSASKPGLDAGGKEIIRLWRPTAPVAISPRSGSTFHNGAAEPASRAWRELAPGGRHRSSHSRVPSLSGASRTCEARAP